MHSDASANTNYPWSSHDIPIQELHVPVDKVNNVYFDSNPLLDHETGQPVSQGQLWEHEFEFHLNLRDLGITWDQVQDEIYWLDIVAIYPESSPTGPGKWLQEPDMEVGVDIWSWGTFDDPFDSTTYQIANEVADDWRCPDGSPIIEVRWWGSFLGWQTVEETPTAPPPMPDYFLLSMHRNSPAGDQYPYSSPQFQPIQTVVVPASDVVVSYYGANPEISTWDGAILWGYEHEYEFRYTLQQPWEQTQGEIYWIDIVGLYPAGNDPPQHIRLENRSSI